MFRQQKMKSEMNLAVVLVCIVVVFLVCHIPRYRSLCTIYPGNPGTGHCALYTQILALVYYMYTQVLVIAYYIPRYLYHCTLYPGTSTN